MPISSPLLVALRWNSEQGGPELPCRFWITFTQPGGSKQNHRVQAEALSSLLPPQTLTMTTGQPLPQQSNLWQPSGRICDSPDIQMREFPSHSCVFQGQEDETPCSACHGAAQGSLQGRQVPGVPDLQHGQRKWFAMNLLSMLIVLEETG